MYNNLEITNNFAENFKFLLEINIDASIRNPFHLAPKNPCLIYGFACTIDKIAGRKMDIKRTCMLYNVHVLESYCFWSIFVTVSFPVFESRRNSKDL